MLGSERSVNLHALPFRLFKLPSSLWVSPQEGDLKQIFEPFGVVESVSVQKDGRAAANYGFVQ